MLTLMNNVNSFIYFFMRTEMYCILKYSGGYRDYFLTTSPNIKPYEYIVYKHLCKNITEANDLLNVMYNKFCSFGLVKNLNNINKSHLVTVNRDAFRMYILKEYNVDMMHIEQSMNEKYMNSINSDSSTGDYESDESSYTHETELYSEFNSYDKSDKSDDESYDYENNIDSDNLI